MIDEVVPESGADAGGLKAGDVILSINGEKVNARKDVTKLVGSHAGGETVELRIRRGEEEKTVKVTLADREKLFGQQDKEEEKEENPFNGKVSVRRIGFTRIIQHDINLEPAAMGGPLGTWTAILSASTSPGWSASPPSPSPPHSSGSAWTK